MKMENVLLGVAMMVALVGGVHAGEGPVRTAAVNSTEARTWQADYRIEDAQGQRHLRIVMDADRVEYRAQGEPVRQWRRVADGVELREFDMQARYVIVHSPGDLRMRGREPDWVQLRYWGMGGTQAGWQAVGTAEVRLPEGQRHPAQRWQPPTSAKAESLQWIARAGVPVHYRHGGHAWQLKALAAVADSTFTSGDGLEEIDSADLVDRLPAASGATPSSDHGHAH